MYFNLVQCTKTHMLYHKKKFNNIYNFIHKPSLSLKRKFELESGSYINNPTIAYKTFGKLNKKYLKQLLKKRKQYLHLLALELHAYS